MKPAAGIAPPAVDGATPSAVQIPRNSPVAPEVPPVQSCTPTVPSDGTSPVPPSNAIHQTSLPSIKTSPPVVADMVILPTTAACWLQRLSLFQVRVAPESMVMSSPLFKPDLLASSRFSEVEKVWFATCYSCPNKSLQLLCCSTFLYGVGTACDMVLTIWDPAYPLCRRYPPPPSPG